MLFQQYYSQYDMVFHYRYSSIKGNRTDSPMNIRKYFLILLCTIPALFTACGGSSGGDDVFIEPDFTDKYTLASSKSYSFTITGDSSGTPSGSGTSCIAVKWEGEHNDGDYRFGFAARNSANTFYLIVSVNKSGNSALSSGTYTCDAVMRYNDSVYSGSGSVPITISYTTASGLSMAHITMGSITLSSGAGSATINGSLVARAY
jgi:hypothetical protein